MDTRVALIGIIIENTDSVEKLNKILSQYASYIIGRMGIPYKERDVSVISLLVDGTADEINALTGSLGRIPSVSVKSMLRKDK